MEKLQMSEEELVGRRVWGVLNVFGVFRLFSMVFYGVF